MEFYELMIQYTDVSMTTILRQKTQHRGFFEITAFQGFDTELRMKELNQSKSLGQLGLSIKTPGSFNILRSLECSLRF